MLCSKYSIIAHDTNVLWYHYFCIVKRGKNDGHIDYRLGNCFLFSPNWRGSCTIEFGNGSPKRVSCFPDAQNTLNVDLLRKYTSGTTPLGFEKNFVILYAWYFLPEPEGSKYDSDGCLNKFPFSKHYIYIRGTIRTFSRRWCFISKFIQLRACINCNYIYWEIAWKWKLFFFVLYFTSSLMRWERVCWQVHAYILMATAFREITLFETKS